MAIGDDWTIDYVNKRVTHTGGATVYSVLNLYSWLQNTFDELGQMDDEVPMSAQTPTDYTLTNGWFVDRESFKYLRGGAVKTLGWDHGASPADGIRKLSLGTAYTPCVAGDIGKTVVGGTSGDQGRLLAFDNATREWWVRVGAAGETFPQAEAVTITDGFGAGTTLGASMTGESLWSNIYTLGSIEAGTRIYVTQDGLKLADWWSDGHLDILVLVKEGGALVDEGVLTIYARQFGKTYDHFQIDVSAGGRNAVPLATQNDLNNTRPEGYLLYDGEANGGFTAGDAVLGVTSGARALVVSVADWGTTGVLGLRNVSGAFQDNESLDVGGTTRGVANGTTGGAWFSYDNEAGGSLAVGETLRRTADSREAVLCGLQDDGLTGRLVVDGTSGPFEDNDAIEGLTSGATFSVNGDVAEAAAGLGDILIAQVSGSLAYTGTGGWAKWDRISGASSGHTAYVLEAAGGVLTLANATGVFQNGETLTGAGRTGVAAGTLDWATTTFGENLNNGNGARPYDVHCNLNGRTLAEWYEYTKYVTRRGSSYEFYQNDGTAITERRGEEYQAAQASYTQIKQSPLGTFAGGTFFGARGIWVENYDADDAKSFQLIDALNVTQAPPNVVTVKVTSLVSGDRVGVFELTGAGGDINRAKYSCAAGNDAGDAALVLAEAIESDTPSAGYVRVRLANGTEDLYEYASWAGSSFNLAPGVTLARTYALGDDVYVPLIDDEAGGAEIGNALIYSANIPVLVRVRRYGILPFEVEGTVTATGLTVAAIRTEDLIVEAV